MYKRHNIWDEDKWDIHSSGNYAGHGAGEGKEPEKYHKHSVYGSSEKAGDKLKDDYRSAEQQEDKDKDKEEKEKTIVDTVEQEEKYRKNEEHDVFKAIAKELPQQHSVEESKKETKKKHHKSIEDAIDKAINEEKKTVFVD